MKLYSRLSLIAAAVLLASCSGATDVAAKVTNNLTGSAKKLMVDIPKSLTATSAGQSSVSRGSAAVQTANSIGFTMIQSTVGSAKMFMPFMAQYSTIIDAVVAQNNLSPSSTTVTGKSLTITQAMLDAMKASVDADLLDTSSMPAVGSNMPMPDFVYNNSTNSNFNYSFAMTDATSGIAMTMTLYWNTDKSKFGMVMSMGGMTMTVANDTATASTIMKIAQTDATFTMKFKADSAAAATQGVFVGMDSTGTQALSISGWADDNGGAVSFNFSGSTYNEEFTGAGAMSYQAYTYNGSSTVSYGTAPTAAYTAKLGNTAWGDAPTFFP